LPGRLLGGRAQRREATFSEGQSAEDRQETVASLHGEQGRVPGNGSLSHGEQQLTTQPRFAQGSDWSTALSRVCVDDDNGLGWLTVQPQAAGGYIA
jgi:hypothetical protein